MPDHHGKRPVLADEASNPLELFPSVSCGAAVSLRAISAQCNQIVRHGLQARIARHFDRAEIAAWCRGFRRLCRRASGGVA